MPTALLVVLLLTQANEITPEITRLDNGLEVVLLEDHALPLVSVQLWYRVGSANDDPNVPGLCHVARTLLEHRNDTTSQLQAAGVRSEGQTLRDACCFTSVIATPESLEYVLKIEAQRMEHHPADAAQVKRALACATDNSGHYLNCRQADTERSLLAAAFPDHRYRNPPELVGAALTDVSPGQVNAFVVRWFVPGNAILLVTGDIQPPAVLDLVHRYFDALPWAQPPRPAEFPGLQPAQIHLPTSASAHAGLDLAWVTPPAGADENAALDVLVQRLCNPVDGPLYAQLLNAGCLPPRWRRESWREAGLLVLSIDWPEQAAFLPNPTTTAPVTANAPDTIERIVAEALANAEQKPGTEIEHNRARALTARELRNQRANFARRAFDLGQSEAVAGDLLLAEMRLSRIAWVRVGEVQQAAAYLRAARSVILPRRAAITTASGPSESLPQTDPPCLPVQTRQFSPPAQPDSAPRTPLPRPVGSVTIHDIGPGVRLVVRHVPGLDQAEVRTWLHPGFRLLPALQALMAVGTTRHSVGELRDYLSYHGLDLYPASEFWRAGLRSRGPASCVSQMIELQAELLRFPNRSATACATGAEHASGLRRGLAQSGLSRSRELYLPPGFIGWTGTNTPATDASILQSALARLCVPRSVEITVTGDVQPEQVCDFAAQVWSEHRAPL